MIEIEIIKQPNGRYALWDPGLADFVLHNAERDELIVALVNREHGHIGTQVDEAIHVCGGGYASDCAAWTAGDWEDCLAALCVAGRQTAATVFARVCSEKTA